MKLVSGGSWMVDLTSASSFYPYGMEIPGRTWNNGTGYRYGWGGHEKDNEIKGDGNSIATHFRLNDPRTGRWFTMDPVTHFSQSPYVSMSGDPINRIDPNGALDNPLAPQGSGSGIGGFLSSAWEGFKNFVGDLVEGGEAVGEALIEADNIVTDFPPLSNPTYFEDNPDYVPGPGYRSGNNNRNYFGEEVGPSSYEDFTFNNGFEGFTAGFINSYLFLGLGNAEDLVPPHQRKFFNYGEQTGDFTDYAMAPIAIVKSGTKYAVKGGVSVVADAGEKVVKQTIKKSLKESFDELVETAWKKYGGNVTVQRDGVDLFRVHKSGSGHGYKVTQFKNNVAPNGKVFKNDLEVKIRKTHLKQLERALKGDPRYSIRTRKGG